MAAASRGKPQNASGTGGNLHPVVCGIYILFLDRRVTYIGKSKDVYGRISSHRLRGRRFDHAVVASCMPESLDWVEAAMIEAFTPPENKRVPAAAPVAAQVADTDADGLPADPGRVVTKKAAMQYVQGYGISPSLLDAALKSGVVVSRFRPPKRYDVLVGSLREWRKLNQPYSFRSA